MLNRGSTAATVSGGNNSVYPTTRSKDVVPAKLPKGRDPNTHPPAPYWIPTKAVKQY
jgi:hypothetical protein